MFKHAFLKQFIAVFICLMSAACSYGQGGGIIDVVTQKESTGIYEVTLRVSSQSEVKISLIASDGTMYLENFVSSARVLKSKLPSDTYQLILTESQTRRSSSYFLRLED